MPGNLELCQHGWARGWASHPVHAGYPLTVHALAGGRVVSTSLADIPRPDGMPGFELPIDPALDPAALSILLGETDEWLEPPIQTPPPPRPRTVEDLIATPFQRPWITGACHLDATRAGLQPHTVIDLLCRDHLGRPAGPVVTATALAQLESAGFDGFRRLLINSSEYKYRRIYAADAPGAIFSRAMILAVAGQDFATDSQRAAKVTQVSAPALLALENEEFVTACYQRILRKDPDRAGMAHYTGLLAAGTTKIAIIKHLSNEFEAISAGISIIDLPP